jgi:hypothetical protein
MTHDDRYGSVVHHPVGSGEQFQRLDHHAVAATVDTLHERIVARFPERSLGNVALELRSAVQRAQRWDSPSPFRTSVRALCTGLAAVVGVAATVAIVIVIRDAIRADANRPSFDWLPVIESAINDMAFAGIAVFFLLSAASRLDRRSALAELHRLRSLAHVIDMHQLTKDPERLRSHPTPTEASIEPDLSGAELGRYLDYCSEMLSLVGKAAALHAQHSGDPTVLDTVSEIETLTIGMSRKIWQKIALIHAR